MARVTRRQFLAMSSAGVGALAVAGLSGCATSRGETDATSRRRTHGSRSSERWQRASFSQ